METAIDYAEERFRPIALHIGLSSWATQGNEENVAQLLTSGAPTNLPRRENDFTHDTPLHQAAYLCHPGIVRRLIAAGALIQDERHNGFTPLHCWIEGIGRQDPGEDFFYASEADVVESGALLIHAGADPDRHPRAPDAVSARELLAQHDRMEWLDAAQALAASWSMEEATAVATGEHPPARL